MIGLPRSVKVFMKRCTSSSAKACSRCGSSQLKKPLSKASKSLGAQLISPPVLGLFSFEGKEWNAVPLSKAFDFGDKLAGDLAQQSGRSDDVAAMPGKEPNQPAPYWSWGT